MINKLYLFLFGIASCAWSYSQECDSTQWAQPGTYVVSIDTAAVESDSALNTPIMLSGNDLCLIESSRRPTETIQIYIGVYLVTIYPKKKFADNTINE